MKIAVSNSAFEDLQGIKEYYTEQHVPEVGDNFINAIFEHIDSLQDHPDIGRIVPEFDENHIRELIHPPFRIVYLRENRISYRFNIIPIRLIHFKFCGLNTFHKKYKY